MSDVLFRLPKLMLPQTYQFIYVSRRNSFLQLLNELNQRRIHPVVTGDNLCLNHTGLVDNISLGNSESPIFRGDYTLGIARCLKINLQPLEEGFVSIFVLIHADSEHTNAGST